MAAWAQLFAAGVLEIVMAFALKASAGTTRPAPTLLAVLAALGSIWLLAAAVRTLPLGVAYAVWTGIGALGVSLVGIAIFAEPPSPARLLCMAFVFGGIAGLKVLEQS
ncbi:QacE family quaternary ammonium compound efflux SMR transporter [Massilia phosphatilytica]|jgi:quaternary ammonium compound-resistance protein SugE|nr:QacE family quaternary ammonium compound efflux SMR transporter [Massilia phosphatilytica]